MRAEGASAIARIEESANRERHERGRDSRHDSHRIRVNFARMPEFLTELKRTHDCGALRASDAGRTVVLFGWVAARRDHGGCVFIDLRDRGGLTQVVFEPEAGADAHARSSELRREY